MRFPSWKRWDTAIRVFQCGVFTVWFFFMAWYPGRWSDVSNGIPSDGIFFSWWFLAGNLWFSLQNSSNFLGPTGIGVSTTSPGSSCFNVSIPWNSWENQSRHHCPSLSQIGVQICILWSGNEPNHPWLTSSNIASTISICSRFLADL